MSADASVRRDRRRWVTEALAKTDLYFTLAHAVVGKEKEDVDVWTVEFDVGDVGPPVLVQVRWVDDWVHLHSMHDVTASSECFGDLLGANGTLRVARIALADANRAVSWAAVRQNSVSVDLGAALAAVVDAALKVREIVKVTPSASGRPTRGQRARRH